MKSTIWKVLEERVCAQHYDSLNEVKAAFIREWENIPQNDLRDAANSFIPKLERIVNEKNEINLLRM